MSLGIGIVGLPNVGKSTLFNAITQAGALAANFPFATIDKNVGAVAVPDERLNALSRVFTKGDRVPPIIPTSVEFVDIAGLVKGAAQGEGLGNQFLSHIREVDAIAHVVRCFDDPNIVHVSGQVNPLADIEIIDTELILADIATLERRADRLRKSARGNKEDAELLQMAQDLLTLLGQGKMARTADFASEIPRDFGLLTAKPIIYVLNVAESDLLTDNDMVKQVKQLAEQQGCEWVKISAQIECEIAELPPAEAQEYLTSLGLTESGLTRLIQVGYRTLGLLTFITSGEKEVRAWTVTKGSKAPQAAGKIHTDFEHGFIRAEVIPWDKLVEAGSHTVARSHGWIRTEGKDYVVQDGDVLNILFNV